MLTTREAVAADLSAVIALLAHDTVGVAEQDRPTDVTVEHRAAFAQIDADPADHLLVAEIDGEVVGCLQLTILRHLTHRGGRRGHVEAVRVDAARRGEGIGTALMEAAIALAVEHDCRLVQLTSNAQRTDAHRFYERLGFTSSHVGFKRSL
jgi:GNAT superfamily N-acetyltransferase